jgi:hypothetical protein
LTREEFIDHFIQSAEYDHGAMKRVFGVGEYVGAVYIGALVIERLLKAANIRVYGKSEPATYNLVFLDFTGNALEDQLALMRQAWRVDARIEPHPYRPPRSSTPTIPGRPGF